MLSERRRRYAITRAVVEAKSGVHRNTLKKWEDSCCGPLLKVEKWAEALGCKLTLVDLWDYTGE